MFARTMGALRISAESPDGTVRVLLTPSTGLRLALHPDTAEHHTENSVEPQIETALFRAISGYDRAITEVTRREFGADRAEQIAELPWREAAAEQIAELTVRAGSPLRHAVVEWTGRDEITVVLATDTLRGLPVEDLADEINAALRAVVVQRTDHIRQITRRCRRAHRPTGVPA